MATYFKRGKTWSTKVRWYDSDGKRHSKSKSGFSTKLLAKQWAVEQESKLNKGVQIAKEISLVDYYNNWVNTYKKDKLSAITLDRYKYTGEALKNFFHDDKIKSITRVKYQEFINQYGATHAPTTVKKVNLIIRGCVKSAILDDYLYKDFTQRVELTANKDKVVKVDYLNLKEIHQLLTAATDKIEHRPGFTSRFMIVTAIYTGMRLAEIQALTWNDIDWLHQTININKSWDMKTHDFKPTKTESSNRKIKVNPELLHYLKILQDNRQSNLVFMNQYKSIPTSNAVNKTLRSLLESLNINRRNFHFHSLRHSHVALLLANGIDLYAISKRLGHSNISITANTYAYLIDEYQSKTDKQIITALSRI